MLNNDYSRAFEIYFPKTDWDKIMGNLERYGRVCYKSENRRKYSKFIKRLIDSKHESVLEHEKVLTFLMVADRGVS